MTMAEKAELLKDTVFQLYSKEGRSLNYISQLLNITRRTLTEKIREWNFSEPEPARHIKPSTEKFINRNRSFIKSRLDADISVSQIAQELGCDRGLLNKVVLKVDPVLEQAWRDWQDRSKRRHEQSIEQKKEMSRLQYDLPDFEGEIWKPILGYPEYEVSNMGRIRARSERYHAWYILRTTVIPQHNREYVVLQKGNGGKKNLQVARLVAHAFVDGYDEEHCTVNHEDGNPLNNRADNLTWMSQSENNTHSYRVLNRTKNTGCAYPFSRIIYKKKYEFKTVSALARFLGKSETQTRRYLEEPEKHELDFL